ncbi:MAG: phospholipid carrier-dependent glycosyltransferase [Sandaracinaceae bacterium]|nr:phospholipid carrier-dependent glycosyltransferase [Sandaracinaceae bacterium]
MALYALVLGVAGWLRLTHLGFAPSTPWARPDEEIFAAVGLGLFSDPNPHVGHTGWPELFFWATHWVQVLLDRGWTGQLGAEPHLGCLFVLDPSRFIVPARAMSALFGWATVALVMRLAFLVAPREAGPSDRHAIALGAGWIYAVNVLAMRDAHFAVSDTALVFFLVWMLVAIAQGLQRGRQSDFLSAGVALGLAISTKWTGLSFASVPFFGLVVRIARHGVTVWPFAPEKRPAWDNAVAIALGILGCAVAFVVTSPSVLDEPEQYWDGIFSHAMRYDPNNYQAFSFRAHAVETPGLVQHATISFPFALGWPLTLVAWLACVHGLVHAFRKRDPMPGLLGFFALFFWAAVVGRTTMNFARYSLPAHPPLVVLATLSAYALASWARPWIARVLERAGRAPSGALPLAMASMLLPLSIEPAVRSFDYVRILGLNDTRELARSWVLENLGDAPVETLGGYGRLYAVEDHLADRCEALLPEGWGAPVPRLEYRTDQSVQTNEVRSSWRNTAGAALYPVLFRGSPPALRARYVVVSRPYLPCGQETVRYDGTDPPPRCYVERAHFEPGELACDAQFDEQDHFYAPLWGYDGLVNLGPSIRIFENVCVDPARGR